MSFIVIFGSAAAFAAGATTVQPRDIDVAHSAGGHEWLQYVSDITRAWARGNGIQTDALDAHVVRAYDAQLQPCASHLDAGATVTLPVPTGAQGHAHVLRGTVRVNWRTVDSVPGLIRVYHADPLDCAQRIVAHVRRKDTSFLFLLRDPGRTDARPDGYSGDGVVAMRNAVRHCGEGEWSSICDVVDSLYTGLGSFFWRAALQDVPSGIFDPHADRDYLDIRDGVAHLSRMHPECTLPGSIPVVDLVDQLWQ